MLSLKGIFPPLPTVFDEHEDLALHHFRDNINKLSQYDLSGFLVLGSNGELVHLSEVEVEEVFVAARIAIPEDKIMLAGTGGQSTRQTIRRTHLAASCGADAVLVLNPFYYKGLMKNDALVHHFYRIADQSPIPVIIYNMPGNSGIDMDAETIEKLSQHDNIVGMKDSSGNLVKMGDIKRIVDPEFQILAGSASFLLPAFSVGAVGGIVALSNILPERCISIYEDFQKGDVVAARFNQINLIPLNTAVTKRWGVPALKAAMDYMGFYGGPARSPLLPLSDENKMILHQLIDMI